jgi:hypothetical protein
MVRMVRWCGDGAAQMAAGAAGAGKVGQMHAQSGQTLFFI